MDRPHALQPQIRHPEMPGVQNDPRGTPRTPNPFDQPKENRTKDMALGVSLLWLRVGFVGMVDVVGLAEMYGRL